MTEELSEFDVVSTHELALGEVTVEIVTLSDGRELIPEDDVVRLFEHFGLYEGARRLLELKR